MTSTLHLYLIHMSAWASFVLIADVYKNGAPPFNKIPGLVVSSVTLGLIGSLVSIHGHIHYLQLIKP